MISANLNYCIPTSGYYQETVQVLWPATADVPYIVEVRVRNNATSTGFAAAQMNLSENDEAVTLQGSEVRYLNEGDDIQLQARQDSGADISLSADSRIYIEIKQVS